VPVTEPDRADPARDALERAGIRAARERGRFERDLDEARGLLERRTVALKRTEARLARVQRDLDRLRSDPVVRLWRRMRGLLVRLTRAPRRLPGIASRGTGPGGSPAADRAPGADRAPTAAGGNENRPAGTRIALLGRAEEGLQDALRTAGWQTVSASDEHLDVALIVDPDADVGSISRDVTRVAWIRGEGGAWLARPWLDDLDLVLVGRGADPAALEALVGGPVTIQEIAGLPVALAEFAERPRLVILIGPASWEDAGHWGDLPFARALERAFRRLGWATAVLVDAERDGARAQRADVALHVVGVRRPTLHPGQTHLLWVISHPDAVRPDRCDAYDAVFVASDEFADQLRLRVSAPVVALHQATDPLRFFPEAGGPAHDLLLVGNARRGGRPTLEALAEASWDLAVYGTGWRPESLDPRHLRGTWIPNQDLHRYYAAAAIVLNDHWADMRDEGFISNRIYDALASGAFVLSDEVPGLAAEFDGGLATWHDAESLRKAVERYLADPVARHSVAERGRSAVLARHTFDHRAAVIVETIETLKARAPA
jgi:glycosyltransferase involved in cell wall biosynthesis